MLSPHGLTLVWLGRYAYLENIAWMVSERFFYVHVRENLTL